MILNKIPGFRTGKIWKKIVSSIVHVYLIFQIAFTFTEGFTTGDKIINGSRMLFFLLIPYVLVTNVGKIRDRLPLFKRKGRTIIKVVVGILVYTIVCLISFSTVFAATDGLISPQQKAIDLVAQQQKEIQAKLKKEAHDRAEAEKLAKEAAQKKAKMQAEEKAKLAKEVAQKKTETKSQTQTKDKNSLLESQIEKAIEDSKHDKKMLKEKLAGVLKKGKQDSAALKQKVDKLVDGANGDYESLKTKLKVAIQNHDSKSSESKTTQTTKQETKKSVSKKASVKQVPQNDKKPENQINSVEAQKAQYAYVDYSQLIRFPKDYKGKKLVNYGTVLTTNTLGHNIISVVEVAQGSLVIVAIPESNLKINIVPNDYIAFYGTYKGVTSSVTRLTSVFMVSTLYYQQAMPYYNAKYIDVFTN